MEFSDDITTTMFVHVAGGVVFDGSSLTLLELAPATVFLIDRPNTSVGHLPTGPFLDHWYAEASNAGARSVPAVLSLLAADREPGPDARVLVSLPRIRGTGLEYQVQLLEGDIPASAGACVLFIRPPVSPATPSDGECPARVEEPPSTAA